MNRFFPILSLDRKNSSFTKLSFQVSEPVVSSSWTAVIKKSARWEISHPKLMGKKVFFYFQQALISLCWLDLHENQLSTEFTHAKKAGTGFAENLSRWSNHPIPFPEGISLLDQYPLLHILTPTLEYQAVASHKTRDHKTCLLMRPNVKFM